MIRLDSAGGSEQEISDVIGREHGQRGVHTLKPQHPDRVGPTFKRSFGVC